MTTTTGLRLPQATHTCESCKFPIANGEGYVHVSYQEIREAEDRERARQRNSLAMTLGELLDEPFPVWHTHHRSCDPTVTQNGYAIDVADLRTWPQILERTCHLSEKGWFQLTDWTEVARRLNEQLTDALDRGGA